ncbi:hypothetical protein ACIHJG_21085 [Streptomyces sp. NPDC052415]|uniref:hypothetical protein n=1 Tax=Streptomyces sp. NPDC052415 TaxID=3365690 RepID=UPI0037D92FF1
MFNRICRTVARLRERYLHKGRHRRPTRPVRPLAASPEVAYEVPLFLHQGGAHTGILVGEETALVRPYVLASEARVRHPSTAGPWFASVGDR